MPESARVCALTTERDSYGARRRATAKEKTRPVSAAV
jgi:hypothetical protein